jgi:hypothetical protein
MVPEVVLVQIDRPGNVLLDVIMNIGLAVEDHELLFGKSLGQPVRRDEPNRPAAARINSTHTDLLSGRKGVRF